MNTFIKATELWYLNSQKSELILENGIYGPYKEFASYSNNMRFKYDEGLPGKTWASKHPIILKDITNSYFKRSEIAEKIGITAAISIPIFAGEYLHAVVIFLCGDCDSHAGAIELWRNDYEQKNSIKLIDGYYGTTENYEWICKNTKTQYNKEFIGKTWSSNMPYIMQKTDNHKTILRMKKASKPIETNGIAIPNWMREDDFYVMSFLSIKGASIVRRFEIWLPDETGEALIFRDGYCETTQDLKELYKFERYCKHKTDFGQVWQTGIPLLKDNYITQKDHAPFDSLLVIPIIQQGFCQSIVAIYN